jgi:hypothetical protein
VIGAPHGNSTGVNLDARQKRDFTSLDTFRRSLQRVHHWTGAKDHQEPVAGRHVEVNREAEDLVDGSESHRRDETAGDRFGHVVAAQECDPLSDQHTDEKTTIPIVSARKSGATKLTVSGISAPPDAREGTN